MEPGKHEETLAREYDHLLHTLSAICSRTERERLLKDRETLEENRKLLAAMNQDLRTCTVTFRSDNRKFKRLSNAREFHKGLDHIIAQDNTKDIKFVMSYAKLIGEILPDVAIPIRNISRLLKTQNHQLGRTIDAHSFSTVKMLEDQIRDNLKDLQKLAEGKYRNALVDFAHRELDLYKQSAPEKAEQFVTHIETFQKESISFWILVKLAAAFSIYFHTVAELHKRATQMAIDFDEIKKEIRASLTSCKTWDDLKPVIVGHYEEIVPKYAHNLSAYCKIQSIMDAELLARLNELLVGKGMNSAEIEGFLTDAKGQWHLAVQGTRIAVRFPTITVHLESTHHLQLHLRLDSEKGVYDRRFIWTIREITYSHLLDAATED